MSGLIDLPTSWELDPFNLHDTTAPDFTLQSRTDKNYTSSIPGDFNAIDDKVLIAQEQIVKSFQSFFSKSQPIIGKLYTGPIDGLLNSDLIKAAKITEEMIVKAINNTQIYGVLWNDSSKKFNTSTVDLAQALKIISENK